MTDLKIELMNEENVADFCGLSTVGGDEALQSSHEHIAWKHLESPEGPSTAFSLFADGEPIGRTVLQPRAFQTSNQMLRGAFMVDLFIHPKFRGGPRFLQLMQAVEEVRNFDFVCHSANRISDQLFRAILCRPNPFGLSAYGMPLRLQWLKRMGFPKEFAVVLEPGMRALLHASVLLFRSTNPPIFSDSPPDNIDFMRVREAFASASGPHFVRSLEFLKWRYASSPVWSGNCRHIYLGDRYCGYLGLSDVAILGGRFCVLSDIMLDPSLPKRVIRDIRLAMIVEALTADFDALYLMLNQRNAFARRLLGYPFFPVPERFLPHPVPLFLHAITPDAKALAQDAGTYLTLADLDYF